MTAKTFKVLPVVVLLCFALTGALLVLAGSGSSPYMVRVYLLSAQRLVPGNNVDIGGVPAGRVTSVQLAPDNEAAGAIVTIQLDNRYAPLGQGTRAIIRPNGVVGDMFLELDTAASGPTIPSGGSIPMQDTQVSVTLDQVTNILNASTRQELKTLTQQGGVALKGRGGDVNHVLQKLPQISSDLAATTGSLDQQTQQLNELDSEFNRVASMIAGEHTALQGDISNGASILGTLAQHQASLQQELQHASSSLGQANTALAGRQQDVRQLLQQMPHLLQVLQEVESQSTTAAATINPCMQNLLTMLNYLATADNYKQGSGSTDGTGYMLRVNPQLVGADTGSFSPQAACAGGGG
jgi:phospholipid/cholesterol/gamma-HCH transport system substrate-binding protein